MTKRNNPRLHRACGGGVEFNRFIEVTGRPEFRCSKCGETWTCGDSGGEWSVLIPDSGESE